MKVLESTRLLKIPKDVKVKVRGRKVTVTGPRGQLSRDFHHMKIHLEIVHHGTKLQAQIWHADKPHAACLRTCTAAVANMIKGVTKGFSYKMRLVYAHFPINVNIENEKTVLEIRNFLGEKIARTVKMLPGVTVDRTATKDEIVLEGNDIDNVSQSGKAFLRLSLNIFSRSNSSILFGQEQGHSQVSGWNLRLREGYCRPRRLKNRYHDFPIKIFCSSRYFCRCPQTHCIEPISLPWV